MTPIDGEYVDARYTFFVALDPETGEKTRMGMGFARDFCKQIEQDIPIWEAKIYRDKPALARGESAITEFRNWAELSYAGLGEQHRVVRRRDRGFERPIHESSLPTNRYSSVATGGTQPAAAAST